MERYSKQLMQTTQAVRGHGRESIAAGLLGFPEGSENIKPDIYGAGELIEQFQDEMASALGKESAIFFPSGTMAQQIVLRVHADDMGLRRVAYHPLCHLEIHEQNGLKELHHFETVLLGDQHRLFGLEDLMAIERVAIVLFELPQREIGGQLPTWDALVQMTDYCRNRGFKLHLDGARLFETLPYYQKTAEEVAALFDTVYISFYKGLGGITGAMLLGPAKTMDSAKIWKRRHGGDLFHLYPYVLSAKYSYDLRKDQMQRYWQNAMRYARQLESLEGVTIVPQRPVCNMFHVHFHAPADFVREQLIAVMQEWDIALFGSITELGHQTSKSEIWIGDSFEQLDQERLAKAVEAFAKRLKQYEGD